MGVYLLTQIKWGGNNFCGIFQNDLTDFVRSRWIQQNKAHTAVSQRQESETKLGTDSLQLAS